LCHSDISIQWCLLWLLCPRPCLGWVYLS
jgi:hypothetical protein